MTNKEKAEILREAARIMSTEWGSESIDEMLEYAEELDPPYTLDRSLRGWVKVTSRNSGVAQYSAWWACDTGLCQWSDGSVGATWEYVEICRWHVEPIRVLNTVEVAVKSPHPWIFNPDSPEAKLDREKER